jgi:hypothetical protein
MQHPVRKAPYVYVTTEVEANYMIKKNPDPEKYAQLLQKVRANDGYCPCRIDHTQDTKCMCKQFLERDSEGFCKCRLYYKEARTKKAAEAYMTSTFTADEKRERELEKEFKKEDKLAKLEEKKAEIAAPDEDVE